MDQWNQYRCCWDRQDWKEENEDEEDDVRTTDFRSVLSSIHSFQSVVRPGSAHNRCPVDVGGVIKWRGVWLVLGSVEQLSVTFQNTQTTLQQLEVPLQVRGRGQRHRLAEGEGQV